MAAQVGARHTVIAYQLAVGEMAEFDIRDKGVPSDAVILRIRHSAAFAKGVAVTDLDATDSARAPDYRVRVIGVRTENGDSPDMQAQTTVTWAHHDADDDGRLSLNRALLAIADGRIEEAIVPANVAVEVTLAAVLTEHLQGLGIGKKRLEPFMVDAVTYSHQLNVLLPVLLAGTGAPAMDSELRGILDQLRKLRNGIGHRGKPEQPLTKETVGRCVAGAVFGFHYVRLARDFLVKHRASLASS